MRNLLTACLPALALFALGGCAGTSALTSSEDDGVYYSSADRTTAVMGQAAAPTSNSEEANPDYQRTTTGATARRGSGSDQYYDNTYTYMRGVPSYGSGSYYGPGVGAYSPYSPYTSLSYAYGAGACGFSPYAYGGYDPFYSSFYSPYGYGYSPYGYGSGISISFGFGRSFGYGGYGSPYGYGYSGYGGFYDPYYSRSPFYGGYYGRGGYYGNSYYGSNNSYNNNVGVGTQDGGPYRTSGHRGDRAAEGRYSAGGTANPNPNSPTGGRVRTSELLAPGSGTLTPQDGMSGYEGGRTRGETRSASPNTVSEQNTRQYNQPQSLDRAERPQYRNMDPAATSGRQQPDATADQSQQVSRNGGRYRNAEGGQPQTQDAAPQDNRRRGGFFQNVFSAPSNAGTAEQPQQRRTYEQPQQRTYEQPQQRTYEQPQQRSYEQPQQRSYSQPSYSSPSNGGSGGGGHSRGRGE